MKQMTVIARAKPEKISAKEKITFTHRLLPLSEISDVEVAGELMVLVPYDGSLGVSQKTMDDLAHQFGQRPFPLDAHARIGFLHIGAHHETDLDDRYGLSLQHDMLPLYLRLEGQGVQTDFDLQADRFVHKTAVSYQPVEPKKSMLSISLKVTDIDEESAPVFRDAFQVTENKDSLDPYERLVNQWISFKPELKLTFQFKLELPKLIQKQLEDVDDPPEIMLQSMQIDWPHPTLSREVAVYFGAEERTAVYDAENQLLRWESIPFIATRDDDKWQYRSPKIAVVVKEPSLLYQQHQLIGDVHVKLPFLYSGTQLTYFDAAGRLQTEQKIEAKTDIKMKFELDLLRTFQQRSFVPFQHLQFPNVVLDEMRIDHVVAILNECGFHQVEVLKKQRENWWGRNVYDALLFAQRPTGSGVMGLLLYLNCTPTSTERRKNIPGDELYKSQLFSGDTQCYIRGQIAGESALLVKTISEVHQLLKERFRFVSVPN